MLRITGGFVVLAGLAAVPAPAQEIAAPPAGGPSVGVVVEMAGEFGGDPVAETLFTDGSTQSSHAGQGLTGAVGLEFRPRHGSPFALRGTVGYKYLTTKATNVSITLTRVPVELVGSVEMASGVRVGAGVVRHMAVRFDGGGLGPDLDFDDATGLTAEVGWRWLALSYTLMSYTDQNGNEYDASNGGLSVIGTFRLK